MTMTIRAQPRPAVYAADGRSCWVLSDGKAGTENQCIGLAAAVGYEFDIKRIVPRNPWRHLPARTMTLIAGSSPGRFLRHEGDALTPPWPDLLIASGRASVGPAIAIRRASGGRTFTVQIQDPRVSPRLFDLVVPPRHDRVEGANVISTLGALNRVTTAKLNEGASRFAGMVDHLPHPRVAVLIGGASRAYRMSEGNTKNLLDGLDRLMTLEGAGLMVTASRRTGSDNVTRLRTALRDKPALIWDGRGDNPYFGFLGLADAIVVTADSVSMTSEACTTGKPVYVAELSRGNEKFKRFHTALRDQAYTRPFTGELNSEPGRRLNETATIANEVRRRLGDTASQPSATE